MYTWSRRKFVNPLRANYIPHKYQEPQGGGAVSSGHICRKSETLQPRTFLQSNSLKALKTANPERENLKNPQEPQTQNPQRLWQAAGSKIRMSSHQRRPRKCEASRRRALEFRARGAVGVGRFGMRFLHSLNLSPVGKR